MLYAYAAKAGRALIAKPSITAPIFIASTVAPALSLQIVRMKLPASK